MMFDSLAQIHPQAAGVTRANEVHWDWLVYLEMFLAGIAAGAYVMAAILSLLGRGRSPLARATSSATVSRLPRLRAALSMAS